MKTSAWLSLLSLSALGAVAALSACSSNKNHDEREEARRINAAPVDPNADPKDACIGSCLVDPGSRPIDCAKAEAGFQYEWAWGRTADHALATYTYDDNTPVVLVPSRPGWQPMPDPIDVCGLTNAVRFKGGPFTEYGGGFGTSFITAATGNDRSRMPNLPPSPEFPGNPLLGDPLSDPGGAFDLREWDGIAIWARRGPNGQSTLRAGLTERNSAEDLNTSVIAKAGENETVLFPERESRYCRRYRLCGCAPGTPCSLQSSGLFACWDPKAGVLPDADEYGNAIVRTQCADARCGDANASLNPMVQDDALFAGRACSVAYTSDGLTGSFCYNPEQDPNPPAKRERCGNPFSRPITVGLDWELFRVPFSELRQADEAHVADEIDLASVKQLVFTHTTGWIDFWVANIGFYRKP